MKFNQLFMWGSWIHIKGENNLRGYLIQPLILPFLNYTGQINFQDNEIQPALYVGIMNPYQKEKQLERAGRLACIHR